MWMTMISVNTHGMLMVAEIELEKDEFLEQTDRGGRWTQEVTTAHLVLNTYTLQASFIIE